MKHLQHFVNLLFSRFIQHLHTVFREGQNHTKPGAGLTRAFFTPSASKATASAPAPIPISKRWLPPLCANT